MVSHFDIVRQFNRQSGDQSNVIVEDISLRPWYERDFARIAWHSNEIAGRVDFGGLVTPLATFSEWIPEEEVFSPDRLKIQEDYISFTNSYTLSDGGFACFMNYGAPSGAGGFGNCGSVEVRIRNAFAKINPEEWKQFDARDYIDSERVLNKDGNPIRFITATVGPMAIP